MQVADDDPGACHTVHLGDDEPGVGVEEMVQDLGAGDHVHAVVREGEAAGVAAHEPGIDATVCLDERGRRLESYGFERDSMARSRLTRSGGNVTDTRSDIEERGVSGKTLPERVELTEYGAYAAEQPVGECHIPQRPSGEPGVRIR